MYVPPSSIYPTNRNFTIYRLLKPLQTFLSTFLLVCYELDKKHL
jgi:hypothetical protein